MKREFQHNGRNRGSGRHRPWRLQHKRVSLLRLRRLRGFPFYCKLLPLLRSPSKLRSTATKWMALLFTIWTQRPKKWSKRNRFPSFHLTNKQPQQLFQPESKRKKKTMSLIRAVRLMRQIKLKVWKALKRCLLRKRTSLRKMIESCTTDCLGFRRKGLTWFSIL